MEQSDKPLFVFFTLLDRYLSSGLSLKQTAETKSLPGLFYIPLAISGCTSCTVALVALDVDNFSCRSIILQKFSFSKVFLLSLRRQLASSFLAISDFPPSFEKFKPVFPFLTFPFFNFESYPPSSLPTTTPVKVLPWR